MREKRGGGRETDEGVSKSETKRSDTGKGKRGREGGDREKRGMKGM